MRIARLKSFMREVVDDLPKPYTEDLIEDAFCAIEASPKWRKEYDDLVYSLGKPVVNGWGAFWVAHLAGRMPGEQVSSARCGLLDSYTKLVKGPKNAVRKLKEPEALEMMSTHFLANKETLSAEVRKHRVLILELLKEGFAPADAFAKVLEKPAMAR